LSQEVCSHEGQGLIGSTDQFSEKGVQPGEEGGLGPSVGLVDHVPEFKIAEVVDTFGLVIHRLHVEVLLEIVQELLQVKFAGMERIDVSGTGQPGFVRCAANEGAAVSQYPGYFTHKSFRFREVFDGFKTDNQVEGLSKPLHLHAIMLPVT
jgi:hypothetical protein